MKPTLLPSNGLLFVGAVLHHLMQRCPDGWEAFWEDRSRDVLRGRHFVTVRAYQLGFRQVGDAAYVAEHVDESGLGCQWFHRHWFDFDGMANHLATLASRQ